MTEIQAETYDRKRKVDIDVDVDVNVDGNLKINVSSSLFLSLSVDRRLQVNEGDENGATALHYAALEAVDQQRASYHACQ